MADVKPCFRKAMVHWDTAEMCQPRSGRVVALNTQPYQAINRIVWRLDLLKLSLHNQAALVNCVQQLNLHHKRSGLLAKARLVRATAPYIELKSLMHNSERVRECNQCTVEWRSGWERSQAPRPGAWWAGVHAVPCWKTTMYLPLDTYLACLIANHSTQIDCSFITASHTWRSWFPKYYARRSLQSQGGRLSSIFLLFLWMPWHILLLCAFTA